MKKIIDPVKLQAVLDAQKKIDALWLKLTGTSTQLVTVPKPCPTDPDKTL